MLYAQECIKQASEGCFLVGRSLGFFFAVTFNRQTIEQNNSF